MFRELLIIAGAVTIFFVTFLLNRRVDVPEGTEMPEECSHCSDPFCAMKKGKDIKSEMKKAFEEEKAKENCPKENYHE